MPLRTYESPSPTIPLQTLGSWSRQSGLCPCCMEGLPAVWCSSSSPRLTQRLLRPGQDSLSPPLVWRQDSGCQGSGLKAQPGSSCTQSQTTCLPALVLLSLLLKHGAPGKVLLFRLSDRPVSLSSVRDDAGPVTEAGPFLLWRKPGRTVSLPTPELTQALSCMVASPCLPLCTDSPSLAAASTGPTCPLKHSERPPAA